jgi:thiamine-phosphate pyrophosphorylase
MMDPRLATWGRRIARRTHHPVLWLFTDAQRLPDPRGAASRLPRGLGGVVLRHDGHPDRISLAHDLARICRARRLGLVVAGDARLAAALHAGVHLRAGTWPGPLRPHGLVTSSAHNALELRRARRAGAELAFLSPVFPTASHQGAAGLGATNWTRLARIARMRVAALGGVDAGTIRRLPTRFCAGMGGIAALA